MTKRSCLTVLLLAFLYVTVAVAQHPVVDAVANKVVQKYQTSSCQQLMQQKAQKQPPSAGEQKAMEMLKTTRRCGTNSSASSPIRSSTS